VLAVRGDERQDEEQAGVAHHCINIRNRLSSSSK
jgi:hypothetical protein